MDRVALEQLLREAEILLHRGEQDIAQHHEAISTLERTGHDTAHARTLLRRLESRQARHVADRNRLFKELTDRS